MTYNKGIFEVGYFKVYRECQYLPVKIVHMLILNWAGHAPEVCHVANRLEIAAAKDKAHFDSLLLFDVRHNIVNFVNFTVSTTNHCNVHFEMVR